MSLVCWVTCLSEEKYPKIFERIVYLCVSERERVFARRKTRRRMNRKRENLFTCKNFLWTTKKIFCRIYVWSSLCSLILWQVVGDFFLVILSESWEWSEIMNNFHSTRNRFNSRPGLFNQLIFISPIASSLTNCLVNPLFVVNLNHPQLDSVLVDLINSVTLPPPPPSSTINQTHKNHKQQQRRKVNEPLVTLTPFLCFYLTMPPIRNNTSTSHVNNRMDYHRYLKHSQNSMWFSLIFWWILVSDDEVNDTFSKDENFLSSYGRFSSSQKKFFLTSSSPSISLQLMGKFVCCLSLSCDSFCGWGKFVVKFWILRLLLTRLWHKTRHDKVWVGEVEKTRRAMQLSCEMLEVFY